jgi:multiple sugar transport system permease protein
MSRTRSLDRSGRVGAALVTPYVLLLLAFGVVPTLYAGYISIVDTNTGLFNGFANFRRMFTDFRFADAASNVALFLALWLPILLIGVLALALVLHSRPSRLTTGMRLVYYLPSAVTGTANILLWMFIVDPTIGPFSGALHALGFEYRSELLNSNTMTIIMAVIAFTGGAGSWIVIMYGGLQSVGPEVMEAATVDGCSSWQMAWHIKLPLLRKYVTYMLIMTVAGGTQVFAEPALLNQFGGVGSPWWSLNQLAYYVGFNDGVLGASAALSVALLIFGAIAAVVIVTATDFFETEVPK